MSEDMDIQAGVLDAEGSPHQFGVWYPIESAPKDGSAVFCFGGFNQENPRIIRWDVSGRNGGWRSNGFYFNPTHWMPLPPPPSQGDRSDEPESTASNMKSQTTPEGS